MILIFYQPYLEKTFDPNCIPGKSAWCRKNLGLSGGKVNLVRRRDKHLSKNAESTLYSY